MPVRTAAPIVAALLAVLAFAGCGSTDEGPTAPDVARKKLETAYAELAEAGVEANDTVTVDGGGVSGVTDESRPRVSVLLGRERFIGRRPIARLRTVAAG